MKDKCHARCHRCRVTCHACLACRALAHYPNLHTEAIMKWLCCAISGLKKATFVPVYLRRHYKMMQKMKCFCSFKSKYTFFSFDQRLYVISTYYYQQSWGKEIKYITRPLCWELNPWLCSYIHSWHAYTFYKLFFRPPAPLILFCLPLLYY